MNLWLLAVLVALACMVYVCWLGAGIIMFPPNMSRLDFYPEQFGLRYEKVHFKTRDGLRLSGWFLPSPTGDERTLLMCHGWGDNKGELLKFTHFLNQSAGFNLLYFDFRSHGESEGELVTMGYYEVIDFEAAVDFLKREKPALAGKLGVFGLSMGAAVTVMAMPDHPELRCAVLESPFTDYKSVVRQWAWNNYRVPYFPLIILTLLILRWRVGEKGVDTYSPIRFVGRIAPRPLFVIGGEKDSLMPEEDVRRLYAAAKDPKQLWIVPEARHAKCYQAGGLEYETRIANFFKRHLA